MTVFSARLPVPPSANRYWRVWRGRAVRSREATAYIALVRVALRGMAPATGPVRVTIGWFRGARRGDLDNRLKVALDALRGLAFVDDRQVVALSAWREEAPADPRLEVTVEAIGK